MDIITTTTGITISSELTAGLGVRPLTGSVRRSIAGRLLVSSEVKPFVAASTCPQLAGNRFWMNEKHVDVMGGYDADDIFTTRWGSRPGSPPE